MRIGRRAFLRLSGGSAVAAAGGALPLAFDAGAAAAEEAPSPFGDLALRLRAVTLANEYGQEDVVLATRSGCYAEVFGAMRAFPPADQHRYLSRFYDIFPEAGETARLVSGLNNLDWGAPLVRGSPRLFVARYYRALGLEPSPIEVASRSGAAPAATLPVSELGDRCSSAAAEAGQRPLFLASASTGSGAATYAADGIGARVSWGAAAAETHAEQLRLLGSTAIAWLNVGDLAGLGENPLAPLLDLCLLGYLPCGERDGAFVVADLAD